MPNSLLNLSGPRIYPSNACPRPAGVPSEPHHIFQQIQAELALLTRSTHPRQGSNHNSIKSAKSTKSSAHAFRLFPDGESAFKDYTSSIDIPSDEVVNQSFFQFDSRKIIQIIKTSSYNLDAMSFEPIWDDLMPLKLLLTYLYTRDSLCYYDMAADIGVLESHGLTTLGDIRFGNINVEHLGLNESIASILSEEINRE